MGMTETLEIKLLTECREHIPYLAHLWFNEISKHWVPDAHIDRNHQNLIKHANRNSMPMTFVAFSNNKPVGMASLRENDGIQPDLIPWLGSLVVDPAHRKCKVGETLIEAIKTQARVFGHEKIYLLAFDHTIPMWYAKLGWKEIGKDILFGSPVTVMDYSL